MLSVVFSWGMNYIRKGTVATTLFHVGCILPWMLLFIESEMYYSPASSNPYFQEETPHDKQVWTMTVTTDLPLPLLVEPAVATVPAQPTEASSLPTELTAGTTTVLPLVDLETSTNTTRPRLKI